MKGKDGQSVLVNRRWKEDRDLSVCVVSCIWDLQFSGMPVFLSVIVPPFNNLLFLV